MLPDCDPRRDESEGETFDTPAGPGLRAVVAPSTLESGRPGPGEAVLSHEIRNAVLTIRNYTELMLEDVLDAEERRRALESCLRASDRITYLMNDAMVAAAAEQRLLSVRAHPCEVEPVVRRVLDATWSLARSAGVNLESEVKSTRQVLADEGRLEHVLVNLVSNAIRHVPSGGHVAIGAKDVAEAIEIGVADDGCGIPSEMIPQLGRPFLGGARGSGGVGLGLYVVKQILQAHGSALRIQSRVGTGTRMNFSLPAA